MIVRPASGRGSHICLRCRRGLAKRQHASTAQKASQSTNSKPHQSTGRRPVRRVVDADIDYKPNNNFTEGLGNALDYKAFRKNAGGGLHGHRGLQVQENRERLNQTTLGSPADVLVLRDSILTLYAAGGTRSMESMEPEHIDILSQLEEERGLAGAKEVESNIDAFRPANERQNWEKINELVKELQDAFTMAQLQRYIRNFQGRRDPERPLEEWVTSQKNAKILRVTPWLPGVSEIRDFFDNDPLRGYFLPSHTAKQRVVLQLLRECWMLELPELVDGIGQFEIEVGKENMELLLMGNISILDYIHSDHLRHEDEKLEAFRNRSVIRVTAPHVKKPFIVQEIESALKRARTEIISLANLVPQSSDKLHNRRVEKWVDRNFDPTTLQIMGDLTNTSIILKQKKSLVISCINQKQNALISPVDVARRLLLTSSNFQDRVEHRLASDTQNPKNGAFIKHEVGNTLPWRDRLRHWSRWTAPTSKKATQILKPAIAEPDLVSKLKTPQAQEDTSGSNVSPTHWSDKYVTETSALIGKVLHVGLHSPDSPPIPLTIGGHNQIHTFSTAVPNLSRVLSKAMVVNRGERIDSIVLRFLPNPFAEAYFLSSKVTKYAKKRPVKTRAIGSKALMAFPTIEMLFGIDRKTKDATLMKVSAIAEESQTDVMLPNNNTDLRFLQRTTSPLKQSMPTVNEFVQKSNLSLRGGKLLQTPPSIRIPIESHLCRGQGLDLLGEVDSKGNNMPASATREVEYLFAGLEIHSALTFSYHSWNLIYTSIEAGKAGGRRAEVKLRPLKNDQLADEADFVNMAYKLATDIGDQENGTLVPDLFKQARRVGNDVDPQVTRTWKSDAPDTSALEGRQQFKYFARRPSLDHGATEKVEDLNFDDVAPSGDDSSETLASQEEVSGESEKATGTVDNEQANKEMEEDLKRIEDDNL